MQPLYFLIALCVLINVPITKDQRDYQMAAAISKLHFGPYVFMHMYI